MPFGTDGTFTPPDGSENAFPGQVIRSAVWNDTFTDIAEGLTDLAQYAGLEFVLDGGGQPLIAGLGGYLEIPFPCTLVRAALLSDKVGSCVVDIWKTTYAGFPPSVANTITAAALPTLATAQSYQDSTLTGWTKTIARGDVLAFNLNSNNAIITKLTIILYAARN